MQVAFLSPERLGEAYDAVVVGAGPAGVVAAIYLTRANLKILVYAAGDIACGRKFRLWSVWIRGLQPH